MEKDKNLHQMGGQSEMGERRGPSKILIRVLILGAVLIVLIALSIGIIKLVPKALSSLANVNVSFSSLFSPKEKVTVSADKNTLSSGQSFNLSFKRTGEKMDGFFVLIPTCQNANIHFELTINNKKETIGCGSQLKTDVSSASLTLTAYNSGTDVAEVPLVVNFVISASNKIQSTGETSIKINPANSSGVSYQNNTGTSTSTNSTGGSRPTYNNNSSYSSPSNGPGDLAVTVTAIGILDRTTGRFIPTTNVTTNDRVAVKFQVENIGQGPSGSWGLKATLPAVSLSDQIKYVNSANSIPAGKAVSGEIYFDYIQSGANQVVQIVIDPNNQLTEIRKDNNNVSVTISATGVNYNGNNGGGYYQNGADLAVRIMDTGIIDRYSGQFSATSYVRSSDRAAVRFQVTNQGSSPSGNWTYSANLPGTSNGNYNNGNNNGCYYSNGYYNCPINSNSGNSMNQSNQVSLSPGESRIFIIGFDGLSYQGSNTLSINLDPNNQIIESNESNNYASVNIPVSGY